MWLVVRALLVLAAVLWRMFPRAFGVRVDSVSDGVQIGVRLHKHKNVLKGWSLGTALTAPMRFAFTRESEADRFLKSIGFVEEVQSGDASFDERVYVACDHPGLKKLVQTSAGLRDQVKSAFDAGFDRVSSDGRWLWIQRRASVEPDDGDRARLLKIERELRNAGRSSWLSDPFVKRVVALELALFALFGYAIGGPLDIMSVTHTLYPISGQLIGAAVKCGGIAVLVSAAAAFALLRGSSRAHRVIVETVLALVIAVPAASFALADDLNRGLDRSAPTGVECQVNDTEERVHRSRKGGSTRSYHAHVACPSAPYGVDLSGELQIDASVYRAAHKGGTLDVTVRRGWLGARWISGMAAR